MTNSMNHVPNPFSTFYCFGYKETLTLHAIKTPIHGNYANYACFGNDLFTMNHIDDTKKLLKLCIDKSAWFEVWTRFSLILALFVQQCSKSWDTKRSQYDSLLSQLFSISMKYFLQKSGFRNLEFISFLLQKIRR